MLPKLVYELLPVLYILGGIIAMIAVNSSMSFISGVLLCASGVIVLIMRRNYRVAHEHFIKEQGSSLA